jgi:hypothetical protein
MQRAKAIGTLMTRQNMNRPNGMTITDEISILPGLTPRGAGPKPPNPANHNPYSHQPEACRNCAVDKGHGDTGDCKTVAAARIKAMRYALKACRFLTETFIGPSRIRRPGQETRGNSAFPSQILKFAQRPGLASISLITLVADMQKIRRQEVGGLYLPAYLKYIIDTTGTVISTPPKAGSIRDNGLEIHFNPHGEK